jgi:hypothetical protein
MKDKYTIWSVITTVVSFLILWLLEHNLPSEQNTLMNQVTLIGFAIAIPAFVITLLQIFKINSNARIQEETFKSAIEIVENNEFIGIVTMAIQQIEIIKKLLKNGLAKEAAINFSLLITCLTRLGGQKTTPTESFEQYVAHLQEIEVELLTSQTPMNTESIVKCLKDLVKLETLLTGVENALKRPKNHG